jgi:hypothetical protein
MLDTPYHYKDLRLLRQLYRWMVALTFSDDKINKHYSGSVKNLSRPQIGKVYTWIKTRRRFYFWEYFESEEVTGSVIQ